MKYIKCSKCKHKHGNQQYFPCSNCNGDAPPVTCLECRKECNKKGVRPCNKFVWD